MRADLGMPAPSGGVRRPGAASFIFHVQLFLHVRRSGAAGCSFGDVRVTRDRIDMDKNSAKAKTGIPGLDDVLAGGYARGHVYLLEGEPGAGKTTLGLQFLLEGAQSGERCLYITLSETETELRAGAASHGWSLDSNIEVCELLPPESLLAGEQHQSLLYASDLELGETTNQIFEAVKRVNPSRLVIDSLSEIRLLAQSSLRYRRQILDDQALFCAPRNHGSVVG